MLSVIIENYWSFINDDVIWDLTHGSLSEISEVGFLGIVHTEKMAVSCGSQRGVKTAFVGSSDCDSALTLFYQVISEVTGIPTNYVLFKTIEDARSWISR